MSGKRLRVGFDLTNTVKHDPGGIAVYVRGLLPELAAEATGIEPVLFIRDGRWFKRGLVRDLLPGAPRKWLPGGWNPALKKLDAFHGLGVRLPRHGPPPRSFTLHDLRGLDAVEYTDPHWARLRAARIHETVARADRILFHTEHARGRFFQHFPDFGSERTAVALPGTDHDHFRPRDRTEQDAVRKRLGLDEPFLLQVGRPAPHKNPEGSIRAAAGAESTRRMYLAFAGGAAPEERKRLEELADRYGVGKRLRWLGRVDREDLPALYSAAELVLMPSHYEGFGFPVLEAMACGAAGVVGAGTSLQEVAGRAWPAVDPKNHEDIADAVDDLLGDAARLAAARQAALERAAAMTWKSCARKTAAFLANRA